MEGVKPALGTEAGAGRSGQAVLTTPATRRPPARIVVRMARGMTKKIRVLSLGLDQNEIRYLESEFRAMAWDLDHADTPYETLHSLEDGRYELLLLSAGLFELSIEKLLEESLRKAPKLVVVVLARRPSYDEAVRLSRCGAHSYLPLDDALDSQGALLVRRIQEICASPSDPLAGYGPADQELSELVGISKAIADVIHLIRLIAPRQSTVLLAGRTGTGKELVARAIHRASARPDRPMVMVNCGAIPENLMEAEFFGHVKGAFTGAVNHRVGRFEQAHRGTIFLDEISELPLEMQSKLLRVLQERELQRVGSSETLKVDVRVVAATNCDLKQMVQHGEFREDLYYRLNVVPITLPSLAERAEDIPLLVDNFLAKVCRRESFEVKRAGPEALQRLMEYSWPGNVRQLENAIEKAVALSGDRRVLYPSDFPLPSSPIAAPSPLAPEVRLPVNGVDFDSVVTQFELGLLHQALQRCGGNKKRAAELLRIKRTTFAAKLRSLQAARAGREAFARLGSG